MDALIRRRGILHMRLAGASAIHNIVVEVVFFNRPPIVRAGALLSAKDLNLSMQSLSMSSPLTSDASTGTVADPTLRLSQRLKAETAKLHDTLDRLVMSTKPFDNRENYGRFVLSQYLFQRDIESLYDDARLLAMIPDLPSRPRLAAAALDLQDLGVGVPDDAEAPAAARLDMEEGLGWLYVSEGSKLGAAFLFKEAASRLGLSETLGARNLAAPEGGRGAQWKRFVQVLDHNDLSADAHDRVVEGARQAFQRFAELLRRSFGLAERAPR